MTAFDQGDNNSLLWGVFLANYQHPWLHAEAYGLVLDEDEGSPGSLGIKEDQGPAGKRDGLNTVGTRLFRREFPGELDYEIESIWAVRAFRLATGWRSSHHLRPFSTYRDRLYLLAALDASCPSPLRLCSGDRDPTNRRNGRFNSLYGRPSWIITRPAFGGHSRAQIAKDPDTNWP